MTVSRKKRVAILISGRGSNMAAILKAAEKDDYPATIALVLSNKEDAAGLKIAEEAKIATEIVPQKDFTGRESYDRAMNRVLATHQIEIVCLAGFMRMLSLWFCTAWEGRIVNIHPSLLPAYPGLRTHERALADGVKIHGCTAHFVVHEMDAGPIIAQAAVPILDNDTPETLAARVLEHEHQIYPAALALVAYGKARYGAGRIKLGFQAKGALTVF
jgi:phosphoribosylglycinamide formyltransferase 1